MLMSKADCCGLRNFVVEIYPFLPSFISALPLQDWESKGEGITIAAIFEMC